MQIQDAIPRVKQSNVTSTTPFVFAKIHMLAHQESMPSHLQDRAAQ